MYSLAVLAPTLRNAATVRNPLVVSGPHGRLLAPLILGFADYAALRTVVGRYLVTVGCAVRSDMDSALLQSFREMPLSLYGELPAAVAARTGRPAVSQHDAYQLAEVADHGPHYKQLLELNPRSGIAVPLLRRDGTPYGSLGAVRTNPALPPFELADAPRLESVARVITADHVIRHRARILPFASVPKV